MPDLGPETLYQSVTFGGKMQLDLTKYRLTGQDYIEAQRKAGEDLANLLERNSSAFIEANGDKIFSGHDKGVQLCVTQDYSKGPYIQLYEATLTLELTVSAFIEQGIGGVYGVTNVTYSKTQPVIMPSWNFKPNPGEILAKTIKGLLDRVKCPECVNRTLTVKSTIIHLNDYHEWSREQIADWLDTLDSDLRFPVEEAS